MPGRQVTGTLFVNVLITIVAALLPCQAGGQPWRWIRGILSMLLSRDTGPGRIKVWLFRLINTLIAPARV